MLTLSIQNLSVHFSGNHVINDVSATLHGGEMVAVVGRNGVGKTTLIKAIARLIKRSGEMCIRDRTGERTCTVPAPTSMDSTASCHS